MSDFFPDQVWEIILYIGVFFVSCEPGACSFDQFLTDYTDIVGEFDLRWRAHEIILMVNDIGRRCRKNDPEGFIVSLDRALVNDAAAILVEAGGS